MISASLSDPWLAVAIGAFVLAVLAIALFARRERRPIASTDAKLDEMRRRMSAMEEKQKDADHDLRSLRMVVGNLPTKESISRIAEQVAESRGQITGMQTTLQSQSRSLDRIEDFLMKASAEHIAGRPSNGDTR